MSKRFVFVLLLLIALVAFLFRFYHITQNPPGLNSDEAAIGYNAYSILKTGRDEFGQLFPLAFRSFDDYKPPLYIYLTVPSIAIFGLNEFAVRFPSAILGVGAVIMTFLLCDELFKRKKVALLAALLLAVSPWHIQFTRTAYETGSMAFFTSLGLLLLLRGIHNRGLIVLAALIFALETYLYQAARVFVPVFSIFSAFYLLRKRSLLFLIPFILFFLPNLYTMLNPSGLIRLQGTSVFQDVRPHEALINYKTTDWLGDDNKSAVIFHPEKLAYFQTILTGYLSHFRFDFLVGQNNDPKVTYVPQVGLLHLWELPFLLYGISFLLSQNRKNATFVLLLWLVLAPLPASITNNLPSSIRTTAMLPALQILTAVGVVEVVKKLKFLTVPLALVFTGLLLFYSHMLFVHAPITSSRSWYYGYKDMVLSTMAIAKNYTEVIVSTKLDVPHIFFLFYSGYDPKKYLNNGGTVSGGFAEQRNRLDNISFRNIDWEKDKKIPSVLLVGVPTEFPKGAAVFKEILNLEGSTAILMVDNKK